MLVIAPLCLQHLCPWSKLQSLISSLLIAPVALEVAHSRLRRSHSWAKLQEDRGNQCFWRLFIKKSVYVEIPLVSHQVLQGRLCTYCTNSRNECVHNKYNKSGLYIMHMLLCIAWLRTEFFGNGQVWFAKHHPTSSKKILARPSTKSHTTAKPLLLFARSFATTSDTELL